MKIYPPELTLKRATESDTTLSYLDVSISICQGKFITEVFDKRDNFNFNYPYMCSNKPISQICDKFASFVKRHRLLTDRLIKQGFWYSKLCTVVHLESLQSGIVQSYVLEGICIPFGVRHDLAKQFTTRGRARSNT